MGYPIPKGLSGKVLVLGSFKGEKDTSSVNQSMISGVESIGKTSGREFSPIKSSDKSNLSKVGDSMQDVAKEYMK